MFVLGELNTDFMMLKKILLLFLFSIAVEAGPVPVPPDSEFKDVSKLLIGKAIHLHWLYKRGFWVAVGGEKNNVLELRESSESKIYFYDWSRFKVFNFFIEYIPQTTTRLG